MLIADADEMLAQLEEAAYSAAAESRAQAEQMSRMAAAAGQPPPAGTWTTPPPAEPVNVERAVCQMLLGRVDDCRVHPRDGPDPSPYDRSIRRLSVSCGALALRGLHRGFVRLADRWIADVAFPSFRDSARDQPGAVHPPVVRRTQGAGVLRSLRVEPGVGQTLAASPKTPARAVAKTVENVTDAAAGSAVPGLRADAGSVLGGGGGAGVARSRVMRTSSTNRRAANAAFGGGGRRRARSSPRAPSPASAAAVPSPPPPSARPSSSSGVGGIGGRKILGALLGAPRRRTWRTASRARVVARPVFRKAPEVDAKVAEQIVRRWQSAKAQALGVAHNLRPLEQVLEGPMLQQWLTRAEDVKAHGWAWEYQLNALTVDKVEVMTPTRVMVEATLTEVAILKDRARTEEDDKYESTYRARYEPVAPRKEGGVRAWKIVGGSVVY